MASPTGGPYYKGDEARVTVKWSDPTSTIAPVDPDTGYALVLAPTTVTVIRPDGTKFPSPSVTVSGYIYAAIIGPFDQSGEWTAIFECSGAYVGHRERVLPVLPSRSS